MEVSEGIGSIIGTGVRQGLYFCCPGLRMLALTVMHVVANVAA